MNLRYHHVSRDVFSALAAGGGGPAAVRELAAAQYSKHMLLLRGVVDVAQVTGHCQAPLARHGYELLGAIQRHDPEAADAVIRYPSVGAWALRTVRTLRGGPSTPGAEPVGLCAVAAAAAIRARLPAEIEVPAMAGAVMLPSLGAAVADGGIVILRSTGGDTEVVSTAGRVGVPQDPHQDAPGWQALRRLRAGEFEVFFDDLDPFRMPAANAAPRLRADEVEMWSADFEDAWLLLARHHPAVAREVAAATRTIVPLVTPPRGEVSSSSAETFGALALSAPPDPCTFALTLAHEVQHLKLSALLDIVTLILPDDGRRFYAPWREDPRPISGLLHGAYAYLGVSGFWRRQRHLENSAAGIRAHAEFARWRAAAARVAGTLLWSGQLTAAGLDFVQVMAGTLNSWQDEPTPAEALELARHEAELHAARWRSANGPIPRGDSV